MTVTIGATGSVDKMSAHLSMGAGDEIQWTNGGTNAIEVIFDSGSPATIQVPAGGTSAPLAVSAFGAQGTFPYRVHVVGGEVAQTATPMLTDTTTAPGEPDVGVGP